MLTICISLIVSNVLAKPYITATVMLATSGILMVFGATLAATGVKLGVVSIGGWWTCYISLRCMLAKTDEDWCIA